MRNHRWFFGCVLVCFWLSGCDPAVERDPMVVGTAVLQEIAPRVCPLPDTQTDPDLYHQFETWENTTRFVCQAAAGHATVTWLTWLGSTTTADAAFEARRAEQSVLVTEYNSYPLLMWTEDHPSFPGDREEYQVWLWQAGQWLIEIRAFDDTHYAIAPHPETVADAIYQTGQKQGLFTIHDP